MIRIEKFSHNPAEIILQILIEGNFNPSQISPIWLFNKNILGKEEAQKIKEKFHNEDIERSFSTEFLDIKIDKEKFIIGTNDLRYIDLLSDFSLTICEELKGAISNQFYFNTLLHLTATDKNKKNKLLLSSINRQNWERVVPKVTTTYTRIIETQEFINYKKKKTIILEGCDKKELLNPYHFFIYNCFNFDNNKTQMLDILSNELILTTLNDNILTTNKFENEFE